MIISSARRSALALAVICIFAFPATAQTPETAKPLTSTERINKICNDLSENAETLVAGFESIEGRVPHRESQVEAIFELDGLQYTFECSTWSNRVEVSFNPIGDDEEDSVTLIADKDGNGIVTEGVLGDGKKEFDRAANTGLEHHSGYQAAYDKVLDHVAQLLAERERLGDRQDVMPLRKQAKRCEPLHLSAGEEIVVVPALETAFSPSAYFLSGKFELGDEFEKFIATAPVVQARPQVIVQYLHLQGNEKSCKAQSTSELEYDVRRYLELDFSSIAWMIENWENAKLIGAAGSNVFFLADYPGKMINVRLDDMDRTIIHVELSEIAEDDNMAAENSFFFTAKEEKRRR